RGVGVTTLVVVASPRPDSTTFRDGRLSGGPRCGSLGAPPTATVEETAMRPSFREHLESFEPGVRRRVFLQALAGAAGSALIAGPALFAREVPAPALIPRQKNPDNLESPFQALDGFITPAERFYVRNHFAQPKVDLKTWRLKVEGAVERPLELSYE